jgi:hypothetical protein
MKNFSKAMVVQNLIKVQKREVDILGNLVRCTLVNEVKPRKKWSGT